MIYKILNNGFKIVKKNNKFGIMNNQNKMITSIKYDKIGMFESGYAHFNCKNYHGYIDEKGKEYTNFKDVVNIKIKIDLDKVPKIDNELGRNI